MTSYRTDTGGIGNISRESSMILSGNHFFATADCSIVQPSESPPVYKYVLVFSPEPDSAKSCHFQFKFLASAGVTINLYEEAVSQVVEAWTTIDTFDNNRLTENASLTDIIADYPVLSLGTLIWTASVGDIVGTSVENSVLDFNCGETIILKPCTRPYETSTPYVFRIGCPQLTAGEVSVSAFFRWIEI